MRKAIKRFTPEEFWEYVRRQDDIIEGCLQSRSFGVNRTIPTTANRLYKKWKEWAWLNEDYSNKELLEKITGEVECIYARWGD